MKRPGAAVVIALLAAAFVVMLAPRVLQVNQLKARSRHLEQELVTLRRQNLELETELKLLRDDPVYLEKVARGKFNKAKEGEIVFKVVRPGESTP